ncbi:MAG TPA: hypothetical protein ENJ54_00970 [Chloroflexi bacterium]|nr:hypothetical protein [Chloroflexota bacterium]
MKELTLTLTSPEEEIHGLPLNDISAILEDLDHLLTAQAGSEAPGAAQRARLTDIRKGSLVLVCELPYGYPLDLLRQIQQALAAGKSILNAKAYEALAGLVRRLRSRNLLAALRVPAEPDLTIELAPDTKIAAPPTIIERATIYGVLTRVGGSDPPRATLQLPNGKSLTVNLTRKNETGIPMARALADRLYKTVGLKGEARIRLTDHAIEHMRADEIIPYNPTQDAAEALAALREIGKDLPPISQTDRFYADIHN